MDLQKLTGYIRRASEDFGMIGKGDRIAVGVSGGKDSLSLLMGLKKMSAFFPAEYGLEAITVSLGLKGEDYSPAERVCEQWGIPYGIVRTDIGEIVFESRREKNPCSLCSKMRKAALNKEAVRKGCNKVAYGHNRDDVIQTFFLSMFYEGRISTFSPVTYLDREKLYVIRPLVYVPESEILGFIRRNGIGVVESACPANGRTKREEIKDLIKDYRSVYKNFDAKVFGAIKRSRIDGWEREETDG